MSLVGSPFSKNKQIGADAGVGFEDAVGQADDGVEVALLHQMFLEPRLDAFAEERAVGQDDGGATAWLEQADDEGEKEIGGLAGLEVLGKVAFDPVLLLPAEGRIGEDDVHSVGLAVADIGSGQVLSWRTKDGSSMPCSSMFVTQSMCGSCFFSTARKACCIFCSSARFLHVVLPHVADGAGEKAAGAAGGVEQNLARVWVDAIGHEGGDGAGRVVLARVAGALQIVEDLLVDVAEVLALGEVVEVDAVDLVDHLAHELAGLHVVVGVLEHVAHDAAAVASLAVPDSSLSVGKSSSLTKVMSGSPVMPSGSAAQVRHWNFFGMGER